MFGRLSDLAGTCPNVKGEVLIPPAPEQKRLLLVQPFAPHHPLLADDPPEFSQPLGLLYLASAAREAGHRVDLADLALMGATKVSSLEPWLKEHEPQVVGLSAPFSLMAPVVEELARFVKQKLPRARVTVGGAHASSLPAKVLACPEVDAVFLGESEISFARYLAGEAPSQIDGIAYRQNGDTILNPKKEWVRELDSLPFPARDLLDLKAYWSRSGRAGTGRWTSFITSRGCPFRCVFCSTHTVWGRRWRPRSAQNVVAELEELAGRYGIDTLSLEDDNFTLRMDRAKEILRLVLEKGLRFDWATPNGLRADRLDEELLELMKAAGFTQAKVAIESGHPRVNRDVIRKNLDLEKAKEVVSLAASKKLPPSAFFVMGFPEETPEEMLTTVEYALELKDRGLAGGDFFMATPYPGTDLLDQAEKRNLLLMPGEDMPFANAFRPSIESPLWDAGLLWFMVRLGRNALAGSGFHRNLVGRCRKEGIDQVIREGRRNADFSPGDPEALFFLQSGWHGPENWPPACRWTKSRAELVLEAGNRRRAAITLCSHAPGPDKDPVPVSVTCRGRELARIELADTGWHRLAFDLPSAPGGERLALAIEAGRTFTPDGDPRVLGVAVSRVELARQTMGRRIGSLLGCKGR